jgi:hypothetical protein
MPWGMSLLAWDLFEQFAEGGTHSRCGVSYPADLRASLWPCLNKVVGRNDPKASSGVFPVLVELHPSRYPDVNDGIGGPSLTEGQSPQSENIRKV